MGIKSVPKNTVKYVPIYGGNKDNKKDPLWVILKPLSRRDADSYRKMIKSTPRRGFRGQFDHNIYEVQRKQFIENVLEVHNFLDCETNEEITEVKRFYDEASDDLIQEIFDVMLDASFLSEEEEKNLSSQSGGLGENGEKIGNVTIA